MSDSPWRLGGRFDLLGPLGTGAAGTVWRGREVSDSTEHAVKLLRPELVTDGAAVTQLYATLNSVAQLAHPGIAAVDDAVAADGWLALRSRLIVGESLRTLLSRQGAMSPPQAAGLIAYVCDTLAAAHAAGIAHGDLHPANVLLGPSSPALASAHAPGPIAAPTAVLAAVPSTIPAEATVTDFGMAALINTAAARGIAATGVVLTAPPTEYRAPELGPAQSDSASADVYAAGILLYECLAGRVPFIAQWPEATAQMHRQSPPPPIAGVTDSLWRIVAACLAKDPRYRPTAAQLAAALHTEAAAAPPAPTAPLAPPARPTPPATSSAAPTAPVMTAVAPTASAAAQTMLFDRYHTDNGDGAMDARPRAASANARLPRVISDHKTESGIAAAVVVAGLLIGAALSMGAGNGNSNGGSSNAAAAGQVTSAPTTASTSAAPQAVVLPSASPSPSPSDSPSPSPSASAAATGDLVFVNTLSSKCMDTAGRVFTNGTTVDIYDCNGTPAQTWTLTATGAFTQNGGTYCLDDLGFVNTPGAQVAIWTCNGGTNQQWTLRPDGSIISNNANLCLDVTGQGSGDSTPLVLQTCDGSPSQQWTHQ